jgi:nitrogen-specific signal transduction histidine kinase
MVRIPPGDRLHHAMADSSEARPVLAGRVTYGIVQEHDGRIEVESEPGRGPRFTVWLPCEHVQATR